ncbi:hypothetical protein QRD38_11415 [Leptospira weilii]|uniref:hypothetical protein n=1 Tax=Leptospira weilii TaxID=28184 RepID=UPI00256EB945|nr:hypothetical protein [Leptospira weilii]MDL5246384.1 hypothetical protein [Leptospira weilii]
MGIVSKMTLLDKIEKCSLEELFISGEIVSLMVPPYKYRVEEFYNCPVFISKTVWIELNSIYDKSRFKKSPSQIIYSLMAGSTSQVIERQRNEEEIFLVSFKGMYPNLNRNRAFRQIFLPNALDPEYLLILSINED